MQKGCPNEPTIDAQMHEEVMGKSISETVEQHSEHHAFSKNENMKSKQIHRKGHQNEGVPRWEHKHKSQPKTMENQS